MAASTHVLELDERRRQILGKVVDHLGISLGTVEHEAALAFAISSVARHDQMDAEQKKVETAICSFAEKFIMKGRTVDATRLLLLASSLGGKPMRVEGHRMVGDNSDTSRASGKPPLEHPYAALALTLALSGSQRWVTTTALETAKEEEEEEEGGIPLASANIKGKRGGRSSWDVLLEEVGGNKDRELAGFGGDSSRLWSTDSEHEEESEGKQEHGKEDEGRDISDPSLASPPLLADTDERDTQEWLQAFEDDDDSPRTDGDGYATDESDTEQLYGHRWGKSKADEQPRATPPPAPSHSSIPAPATNSDSTGPVRVAAAGRASYPPAVHKYGAPCIGADIRSLGAGASRGSGTGSGNGGGIRDCGDAVVSVPAFLRPCQTLEACQTQGGMAGRRRSIPEAEVVRAALHMLQGLSGTIFVRVGDSSCRDYHYHHQKHFEIGINGGGGGGGGGGGKQTGGGRGEPAPRNASGRDEDSSSTEPNRTSQKREYFSLSESALGDLAVASLSPKALAGILGDLVRLGSDAEYLRAFIADAEAYAAAAAAAAAARRGACSHGGSSSSSSKHGHTTQSFVTCVRRQLEAFEDAVARRDRWLYRRQDGREGGSSFSDSETQCSGETIVGLLSLLRPEAESLELTRQLVEAGAGWWVNAPPGEEEGPRLQLRHGDRTAAGKGWDSRGLRERTGQLLTVLHDALVSSALLGVGLPRKRGGGSVDEALAPRRHGWLLRVFCEVLAPYLRLVDAWITEGRMLDPHGELFFSHLGGGGSGYGIEGGGGGGGGNMNSNENTNFGGFPRRTKNSSPDPVVHVGDTGIVIHSKALPPFFASLASAVALAGQDILLMRRVRALVASSSSLSVPASFRSNTGFSRSRQGGLLGRAPSSGVLMMASESENFSLATTLEESLRRLAFRVRRANDAGLDLGRESREDQGGGGRGYSDRGSSGAARSNRADLNHGDDDDDDDDEKEEGGAFPAAETSDGGGEGAVTVTVAVTVTAPTEAAAKQEGVATTGDEPQSPHATRGVVAAPVPEGDDADDGDTVGVGDRRSNSGFGDAGYGYGRGGGGPATQPEMAATEEDPSGVYVGGGGGARSAVEEETKDDLLGFFGGTAQLALIPGAMFRRSLHPALAAPLLPPPPPPPVPTSLPSTRRTSAPVSGQITSLDLVAGVSGTGNVTVTPRDGSVMSGVAVVVDSDGDDDDGDGDDAAMTDDVARALPPTMVLETCLLGPLREHCRLASLSCLGVFEDELGVVGLAGVLRDIYLSPGGAKSDTPLSRFRGVLFSLLGALQPSPSLAEDGGSFSLPVAAGAAMLDGVAVRDIPAFLKDGPRLTALLQSSLAMSGADRGGSGDGGREVGEAVGGSKESGGGGDWPRSLVVGNDRPLFEHFFVECRPEVVREWRRPDQGHAASAAAAGAAAAGAGAGAESAGAGAGTGAGAEAAATTVFPLARGGRCVDLRALSCLQLECRLPWPISVALPPRSMDKYSRALGLLLKLEFTTHVLEGAHVLHSHAQRDILRSEGELDRRHLQQCRLFAFLRVARAVRSYAVTQALVKPWTAFEARVSLCGSLRGFIRLHEAYLDLILERCFLLPRSRQTLAYLLDALQTGIAFSQRYGEYVAQLAATTGERSRPSSSSSSFEEEEEEEEEDESVKNEDRNEHDSASEEACRESLRRLDELWEDLASSLGFVIPLLKEMVRSRRGVHVNELLIDLDFNRFFERREAWRTERRKRSAY